MSNVLKSIGLDYYVLKDNLKMFLAIAYVLGIVIGSFTKSPYITVPIVMILSALSSGTFFSIYERNNLSKLYGSLPLRKNDVVIGRYLFTLIYGVINWIVSVALALIFLFYVDKGVTDTTFMVYISVSFFYFCLFVGVSFPIYFKYGFSKAYIYTSLPFYFIFIIGLIISRNANFAANLKQIVQYFTDNPAMIWVIGIGLGLIIIGISTFISSKIYKKSDL